jgi:hypothetical protein
MSILLDCPGCGRQLRVIDQYAGRRMRCPRCGTAYTAAPQARAAPRPPESHPAALPVPSVRPVAFYAPGTAPPPAAGTSGGAAAAPDADELYAPCERCDALAPVPPDFGGRTTLCAAWQAADERLSAPAVTDDRRRTHAPAAAPQGAPPAAGPLRPDPDGACPECGAPMNADAVVCLKCGFNKQMGKRLKTVSRRLSHTWYSGQLHPAARVVILVLLTALFFLPFLAVPEVGDHPALFLIPAGLGLLLLLLLGSFQRLTVTTDPQGRPVLLRNAWFAFVPAGWSVVELGDYRTVRMTHTGGGGEVDVGPAGLIGRAGVGFLLFGVIGLLVGALGRPGGAGLITLEIVGELDERGEPFVEPLRLYRGRSDRAARALGDALEQIAGLRYG